MMTGRALSPGLYSYGKFCFASVYSMMQKIAPGREDLVNEVTITDSYPSSRVDSAACLNGKQPALRILDAALQQTCLFE